MYQSFLCLPKHILRPSPLVQSNLLTQAMGWNIGCQVKGWRMSERSYKAQSDAGLTRWQVKIPCEVIWIWKGPNHLTRYKIPCQVIWVYLGDKCWSIPGANNYSSGSNTAGSKHRPVEQGPHLGNHSLRTLTVWLFLFPIIQKEQGLYLNLIPNLVFNLVSTSCMYFCQSYCFTLNLGYTIMT